MESKEGVQKGSGMDLMKMRHPCIFPTLLYQWGPNAADVIWQLSMDEWYFMVPSQLTAGVRGFTRLPTPRQ